MLTFTVVLGYQGLLFRDFCDFFFRFFFFNPTDRSNIRKRFRRQTKSSSQSMHSPLMRKHRSNRLLIIFFFCLFAAKGAIYYITIETVIFSHTKIQWTLYSGDTLGTPSGRREVSPE